LRRADAAGVVPAADVERHMHSGGGGHLLAWSDAAVLLTVCTPAGQPLAPHTHTHTLTTLSRRRLCSDVLRDYGSADFNGFVARQRLHLDLRSL